MLQVLPSYVTGPSEGEGELLGCFLKTISVLLLSTTKGGSSSCPRYKKGNYPSSQLMQYNGISHAGAAIERQRPSFISLFKRHTFTKKHVTSFLLTVDPIQGVPYSSPYLLIQVIRADRARIMGHPLSWLTSTISSLFLGKIQEMCDRRGGH